MPPQELDSRDPRFSQFYGVARAWWESLVQATMANQVERIAVEFQCFRYLFR